MRKELNDHISDCLSFMIFIDTSLSGEWRTKDIRPH